MALAASAALAVEKTLAFQQEQIREATAEQPRADAKQPAPPQKPRPEEIQRAVATLMARLHLGAGADVADVGAGGGLYTWPLAEIVGSDGTVLAEEITKDKVDKLQQQATAKGLKQVRAVLGRDDDPGLPADSVDLVFLRLVYHHFAKPREMLRAMWRALRPGGYLVVVDQRRGTLQDWVPREVRTEKHHWTAETTVVREAREEGFAFVECAEDGWHEKDPFVLIFRRPEDAARPAGDPDPFQPLPVDEIARSLIPPGTTFQRPVLIALGDGRRLIEPILKATSGRALEIVLEEWATQKDERPPLPAGVSLPATLTENGDPRLGPEPIDAVFFLDSYHLLFHEETLLARLHEKLTPAGRLYVLDRKASEPLTRRDSSHRRLIDPQTVKEKMSAAGFVLQSESPTPAPDRFLLVFGKAPAGTP